MNKINGSKIDEINSSQ
ncbi:hypothetical protein [Plasmodium yoelii yoelii]|uniref:Uncharacterized protein n=1 Tax=Plasmodium yoelii yoelii TaxID=73239 RepID=Q7RPP5_PLAYO|nr:hypothetical protein [Plasmodium yoelii yoelii]